MIAMQVNRHKNINKQAMLRHTYPVVILMVIALISYWTFYAPILYSDDWSLMVGRWYFGNLNWFDLTDLRPLLKARLTVLYGIFGLNIHAFYIVLWLLNVLNVIQLYLLVVRFIPKHIPIALSIGAIALIYPADFTHMWLTMIQIRTVVLLALLYAHLLLIYADTGRRIALWAALLCLLVSFGMHEGQLGVAMAWSLLVTLMHRNRPWQSWLPLLLPLVIGLAFIVWQVLGTSVLGIRNNYRYVNDIVLTPTVIIGRLLKGFQIMVWAWVEPLMLAFDLTILVVIGSLLFAMMFCSGLIYLAGRIYPDKLERVRLTHNQQVAQLHVFLMMMLVGTVFIAPGYVPVVALFQPSLFPIGSRVNLFPSMGAAVTLVSLITVVVMIFWRKQPQINLMVLAAIVPLVVLGSMVQLQVQYDNRTLWEEQKKVWHEFFDLVPDLKDGTVVYFIFAEPEHQTPGLYRTKRPHPLRGAGDVGAALNILYGKYDLSADVITEELLLKAGVKVYYSSEITPYDHIILVVYDGNPRRIRIVEDLEAEGLVNFPVPTYAPYEHIVKTPTTRGDLRWLVGAKTAE